MTDVWDFYAANEDDRGALAPVERGVLAICDFRQEVNSGGFETYFCAWGGDTAPIAAASLNNALGGGEWSALLVAAMALFGANYPLDADARAELIDRLGLSEKLNAFDELLYSLEGSVDADAVLTLYLESSRSHIVALRSSSNDTRY